MRVSDIPLSPFNIAEKEEATICIVHKIGPLNPEHLQALGKSVRDLTYRLQYTKPEVSNLLSCEGFCEHYHYGMNLAVILRAPSDLGNPRSLRDQLINNAEPVPVSERLSIAQELAKTLGYAYALSFSHINVHPENIIRLQTRDKNSSSAFLAALVGTRDDRLSPDDDALQGEMEQFLVKSAKQRFVDLVCNELCDSMGTEYSEVVEMCLTCLDPYRSCGFSCECEIDEYGIRVGVEYIDKILQQLYTLHVNIQMSD
ncbi:hypothetical protein NW768_009269 [Fusarium equiseti]|uniref:Protein kinase domain-containing protein n=1 Tax=Fusarium equiseti TaxID=61235 RepID=A0ABQ8R3B7_FUSEQ|nr:hypothetical protein NW768_009269 [Fusarium equiseti]